MWAWASCVAFALLLCSTQASAQTAIDLTLIQDVARAKAEEGLTLFAEEKWAEAYERFRLAEELYHAPTLGLHMGHCKRQLGELLAAQAHYREVADEQLQSDAPLAFQQAREEAASWVMELDGQIPRVTIQVSGADADALRVSLDGLVLTQLVDLAIDPGAHRVEVRAPGLQPQSRRVELAIGARERLSIVLTPAPASPPVRQPSVPRLPPPDPGSLVPAFIVYGIGAAGLITGVVAGAIAIRRVAAIRAECDDNRCPDRLIEDAGQAQLASTVANVGLIIAGVGAIAGTVLVLVRPGSQKTQTNLRIGPGRLLLEVTF